MNFKSFCATNYFHFRSSFLPPPSHQILATPLDLGESLSLHILALPALADSLLENMTSCTKSEIHNVSQRRQSITERRPQHRQHPQ